MATLQLPAYLKWREGRPRWEPGPRLRQEGWQGRDLKDQAGAWCDLAHAIDRARSLNDQVAAARAGGAIRGRRRPQALHETRTIARLVAAWKQSPKFGMKRASTRRDYLNKARVFEARFGDVPLAALEHAHLYGWWSQLYAERGHAMANGVLAVARLILSHARRIGWRRDNPAHKLGLETVVPRVVVWSPSEIEAMVATADAARHCWLGDAIVLALHTGQRQADVLGLDAPTVENGQALFQIRQRKTAARVRVPLSDALARRLADLRRRRAAIPVVDLANARRLVVRPDGGAVTGDYARKAFAQTRARVAREMPAVAAKTFADLRDTAVTRLALAGCTLAEIRAITGHSLETVHQILKHYLAIDDRMAAAAVDRLNTWMQEEGIAL